MHGGLEAGYFEPPINFAKEVRPPAPTAKTSPIPPKSAQHSSAGLPRFAREIPR